MQVDGRRFFDSICRTASPTLITLVQVLNVLAATPKSLSPANLTVSDDISMIAHNRITVHNCPHTRHAWHWASLTMIIQCCDERSKYHKSQHLPEMMWCSHTLKLGQFRKSCLLLLLCVPQPRPTRLGLLFSWLQLPVEPLM